jgi:DNA repair protein RecO (recombination protein O)
MKWVDDGIFLRAHKHGESSYIVSILSKTRGRQKGLVRFGRRDTNILQPSYMYEASWNARLEDHLGFLKLEPKKSYIHELLYNLEKLTAINAINEKLERYLPERQSHDELYNQYQNLLENFAHDNWRDHYLSLQLFMLKDFGFGIDLSHCALCKKTIDLKYLSPVTGKSACSKCGEAYHEKLFLIPDFLACPPPYDKNTYTHTQNIITHYMNINLNSILQTI